MNEAQIEAVKNANAYLNNAGLPTYNELEGEKNAYQMINKNMEKHIERLIKENQAARYATHVARNEIAELRGMLAAMGFLKGADRKTSDAIGQPFAVNDE